MDPDGRLMEAGRVVPGVLQSWGITSWGAWDSLGVTGTAGRLKKPSLGHFGLFLAVEALGSPLGVATRTWWMYLEARGSGIPALQLLCKPWDGVSGCLSPPRGDTEASKTPQIFKNTQKTEKFPILGRPGNKKNGPKSGSEAL